MMGTPTKAQKKQLRALAKHHPSFARWIEGTILGERKLAARAARQARKAGRAPEKHYAGGIHGITAEEFYADTAEDRPS